MSDPRAHDDQPPSYAFKRDSDGEPINARSDHHCFGCGHLNASGLKLSFFPRDAPEGGVIAPWTPPALAEGYIGMVHGGIISTVLDEVMAWACYHKEIWGVTARINVRFRKPVLVSQQTLAEGWITSDRGRTLELAATLRDRLTGDVLAEATATFMRVPESQAAEWRSRYLQG